MTPSMDILIADDDPYIRDDLKDLLKNTGYRLHFSASAKETEQAAREICPDLILLDLHFPDCQDLSLLKNLHNHPKPAEIIVLTSQTEDLSTVVSAIKAGAYDYVGKPFAGEELKNRITKALAMKVMSKNQNRLLDELQEKHHFDKLIGDSPSMTQVRQVLRKLCDADGTVLILGECGTGKELAARAIHYLSARRNNPFIALNCASIPEHLVESVFFGHRKGAFTGAVESAKGKFEVVEDGTLFLDEIGDMPMAQQAALLRVLEYRSFVPIGEHKERPCRARFVLATNRDLKERVREGKFREDLYYRIHVAPVLMPPLRARPSDIPVLVEYFLNRLTAEMGQKPWTASPAALELLSRYEWHGNVRELRNVLESALMLRENNSEYLDIQDLPIEIQALQRDNDPAHQGLSSKELGEKEELMRALRQTNGNQSQAAKILGCHRNTIRSRLIYFGLNS